MGLVANVFGFREGFRDDEFGHVDFVLEEVGDGVFDVAEGGEISELLKGK